MIGYMTRLFQYRDSKGNLMDHITRYPEYRDSLEKIHDALINAIGDHGAVDYSPHLNPAMEFKKSDITNRLCTATQMLIEIDDIFETCLVIEGEETWKNRDGISGGGRHQRKSDDAALKKIRSQNALRTAEIKWAVTEEKIRTAIDKAPREGIKPTQKNIANLSGLGIATVKRHWKTLK